MVGRRHFNRLPDELADLPALCSVQTLFTYCKESIVIPLQTEKKTVTFKLTIRDDLSFIGIHNKRIVEPGWFKVIIGNLEKRFRLF